MIKVGITGGIGVGKSYVAKIFKSMNIPIYNADFRAKYLIQNDPMLIEAIKVNFGPELYDENNQLDRKKLSSIVFSDEKKLKILNLIVHPVVREDAKNWFFEQHLKNVPYALKEAALIFETKGHLELDKVIVVTAPLAVRIERTMARDRCTRQEVLDRIDKQLPENDKKLLANYLIDNSGEKSLLEQVNKIHEALCKFNEDKGKLKVVL